LATQFLRTLLAFRLRVEGEPVALRGFFEATVEPKVGVAMGRDLTAPRVTPQAAWAASAGLCAAVVLRDFRAVGHRSLQHRIVCNTSNGGHVLGARITSPTGIELRREGMVLRKNGQHQGSATTVEALGNPIHSVAFLANQRGGLELELNAGLTRLTESIVSSIPVVPGASVQVEFFNPGDLALTFVAEPARACRGNQGTNSRSRRSSWVR
jgi:2-keto-4-pentenoate hydratase